MMLVAAGSVPAFADGDTGTEQIKNVKSGSRNVSTGWVEVLDNTHAEAAKGKTTGEQLTGVVAGGAIGVRRTIHRLGAGVIDLVTFWIPKKQSLINPEHARLE
jgi:putative exosortase-associated protein (TIGR04073 family)